MTHRVADARKTGHAIVETDFKLAQVWAVLQNRLADVRHAADMYLHSSFDILEITRIAPGSDSPSDFGGEAVARLRLQPERCAPSQTAANLAKIKGKSRVLREDKMVQRIFSTSENLEGQGTTRRLESCSDKDLGSTSVHFPLSAPPHSFDLAFLHDETLMDSYGLWSHCQ
ncbi:hypothetical protein C8R44DRAFT_738856 [Mycena epipterygia]|nr:hypothetical protein C8R44DRAFT_738856 [Mycena epipterygia]